jgi:hypothetical protein
MVYQIKSYVSVKSWKSFYCRDNLIGKDTFMRLILIVVSAFCFSVSSSYAISNSGLLIHCSMDSAYVTAHYVVNETEALPNLTLNGNCIRGVDRFGMVNRALTLDGSTYLSCVVPSDIVSKIAQGDFSLGIMIKTTDQTGSFTNRFDIAGIGDPYNNGLFLTLNNSRGRIFLGNHGYYDTPDTLSDGKWHFLLATRSSGKVTLYLDGHPSDSGAYTDTLSPATNIFIVGRHGIRNESFFKGDIDELFFYSRALSSDEVSALYSELVTIPIKIYSPADSVVTNPLVFKWSPVKNSIAYALEIDTSATFTNPIVSIPVEDTTAQLNTALPAREY